MLNPTLQLVVPGLPASIPVPVSVLRTAVDETLEIQCDLAPTQHLLGLDTDNRLLEVFGLSRIAPGLVHRGRLELHIQRQRLAGGELDNQLASAIEVSLMSKAVGQTQADTRDEFLSLGFVADQLVGSIQDLLVTFGRVTKEGGGTRFLGRPLPQPAVRLGNPDQAVEGLIGPLSQSTQEVLERLQNFGNPLLIACRGQSLEFLFEFIAELAVELGHRLALGRPRDLLEQLHCRLCLVELPETDPGPEQQLGRQAGKFTTLHTRFGPLGFIGDTDRGDHTVRVFDQQVDALLVFAGIVLDLGQGDLGGNQQLGRRHRRGCQFLRPGDAVAEVRLGRSEPTVEIGLGWPRGSRRGTGIEPRSEELLSGPGLCLGVDLGIFGHLGVIPSRLQRPLALVDLGQLQAGVLGTRTLGPLLQNPRRGRLDQSQALLFEFFGRRVVVGANV